MKTKQRDQTLSSSVLFWEAQVADCIDRVHFRRRSSNLGGVVSHLESHATSMGMHAYYVGASIDGLKQWFYVASRLALYNLGKTDDSLFDGIDPYTCALLTDNEEVIQAMARVTTKRLHQGAVRPTYGQYLVNMYQIAMRGEDELLPDLVDKLGKHGRKPWRQEAAARQDFFSLLLARDEVGLQQLIQDTHARIKAVAPAFEGFMSLIATIETKLCWRRGIEIQIDSPLVPMPLMPVKPLPHYDLVYDFLQPNWKPPIQGWLGRMLHRLQAKAR